jgi:hypothetical protein
MGKRRGRAAILLRWAKVSIPSKRSRLSCPVIDLDRKVIAGHGYLAIKEYGPLAVVLIINRRLLVIFKMIPCSFSRLFGNPNHFGAIRVSVVDMISAARK